MKKQTATIEEEIKSGLLEDLFIKTVDEVDPQDATKGLDTSVLAGHFLVPLTIIFGNEDEAQQFLNELDTQLKDLLLKNDKGELKNLLEKPEKRIGRIRLDVKMRARLIRVAEKMKSGKSNTDIINTLFEDSDFLSQTMAFYSKKVVDKKLSQARENLLHMDTLHDGGEETQILINELYRQRKRTKITDRLMMGYGLAVLLIFSLQLDGLDKLEVIEKFLHFSPFALPAMALNSLGISVSTKGKKADVMDLLTPMSDTEAEAHQYLSALIKVQSILDKCRKRSWRVLNEIKKGGLELTEQEEVGVLKEAAILHTAASEVYAKVKSALTRFEEENSHPIDLDPKARERLRKDKEKAHEKAKRKHQKSLEKSLKQQMAEKKRKLEQQKAFETGEDEREYQRQMELSKRRDSITRNIGEVVNSIED